VAQKFCQYCKIEKNQIERLVDTRQLHKKNFRGMSLEIDRLDSNDEYKKDNCVIACYWCNNAKTDEFTPEEFIPVAEKIHEIWKKRLNGN
jgi:5-methylcytosine-specific restriction endonuclease McrA